MPAAVKPPQVEALKRIALKGALQDWTPLSSGELGRLLGVTQQSAARRILELLKGGYLARDLGGRQPRVKVTAKGVEALRREFAEYQRMFDWKGPLTIRGEVTAGLGEGAFYMRQEGYKDQFRRKLLFEPYEGTLNLRVEGRELSKLELLRGSEGLPIDEFKAGGRTYGAAKCYPATLRDVPCAVILPLRTHHTEILEVIAAVNLRQRLGLQDGERVEMQVRT
ncbi:MAG TPA: DUF120 domain-containing protein [Thermoplasmata archaeon]|nr:DUF120 domain-containing protein [Thermoplasmata archaeon]